MGAAGSADGCAAAGLMIFLLTGFAFPHTVSGAIAAILLLALLYYLQ